MKLADLKLLLPRIRYSSHTPKSIPVSEGYYMSRTPLKVCKPSVLEKTPPADEYAEMTQKSAEELCEGVSKKHGCRKLML